MIIDYIVARECQNKDCCCTCLKCGKCGRVFENGYMVDDGGTTIDEESFSENIKYNCYGNCETCEHINSCEKDCD